MKRNRLGWIAMAGVAAVLASILAFLYVRARGHNPAAYMENVVLLRQLKQLDARWDLDVLKSKMGIDVNYDALVNPLVDLRQLREQFETRLMQRQQAGDAQAKAQLQALMVLSGAFHQAIEDKSRLIEHFKSHNSVLRNSLAYLPTAAGDIERAARAQIGDGSTLRQFSADVNKLLLDSVVFSQSPTDERETYIQGQLERLSAAKGHLPLNISDALDVFVAHVRTVLREQLEVNALVNSIAAVPTAKRIDALENLQGRQQLESEQQSQVYRRYLMIFAAALACLFLHAAVSLISSDAVINRVNRELKATNASLEDRVKARTSELHAAQGDLMATARHAGMAEIANNVLHNVGNVLNSVNVSAGLIGSKIRGSKSSGLSKAVQLIEEHSADLGDFMLHDEKGRALPGYLHKLALTLVDEQKNITAELDSLTRNIDHIKGIVTTQQSYAGTTSVIEAVQIKDLLEDALSMNIGSAALHQITIVREYAEVPAIPLDKHLVLQILVNLIGNAKRAMESAAEQAHQLTLRMEIADSDRLRIAVQDDGEGIAPENLDRLFAHGFTTRKNGHGFGLHSCSLAAKEMRGTITAYSEGLGRGATFILELPLATIGAA